MTRLSRAGRITAAAIAAVGGFALGLQLVLLARAVTAAGGSMAGAVLNFFSFFTILTNGFVAVVMARIAIGRAPGASLLGCATLAIAVVGLVYSLALRWIWNPEGWQKLADMALHDVMPVLTVLFWLVFVPHGRLAMRDAWLWLLYPLGYLGLALIRGAADGWYAYWFLDAATIGYPAFFRNAALVAALFLALGAALVGLDRWLGRRSAAAAVRAP